MEVTVDLDQPVVRRRSPTDSASEETRQQTQTLEETLQKATSRGWTWATVATLLAADTFGFICVVIGLQLLTLWTSIETVGHMYPIAATFGPVLLLAFALSGFYRQRFVHPAVEMKQMASVIAMIGGTATLTSYLVTGGISVGLLIAAGALMGTILVPAFRGLARVLFAQLPWWGVPAVVVSFGEGGQEIINTLSTWPEIGLRPVAWLGDTDRENQEALVQGDPTFAPYMAKHFDIPYLIVSMPERSHAERAKLLKHYSKFFDQVFSLRCTDSPVLWTTGHRDDGLRGYGVCNAASKPLTKAAKRIVDVIGAGLILFLVAPLFLAIAARIYLDRDGPVFYRQERLGESGETFTLLKFRSMHTDAEERLAQVLASDPQKQREYEKYHKLEDDPRVTEIGEILREYSLDELPQLLNVLRGDMSLIGPRAYLPSELPKMKGLEQVILQTPPGITGLWQVSGRNHLEFKERVDLDVHYVQNWSPWLDLYLLLRTIPTALTGKGAS